MRQAIFSWKQICGLKQPHCSPHRPTYLKVFANKIAIANVSKEAHTDVAPRGVKQEEENLANHHATPAKSTITVPLCERTRRTSNKGTETYKDNTIV